VGGARCDTMRERRFFVERLNIAKIELDEKESHHAAHVLRLRPGDEVSLFDGQGRAHRGQVIETGGKRVIIEVGAALRSNESPLRLSVAVAAPKGDTMSLIVQKLTELGVSRILPLVAERSDATRAALDVRIERWRRMALEAAKQCGRSAIPELSSTLSLEELLDSKSPDKFWIAHPDAAPLTSERIDEDRPPTLIVGPEGGWSPQELELTNGPSVERFGLGPRTLRVETAAVTGASLFQWLAGDLRRCH
jgi:16S rRNA (uracil1498-N3)-methyltransferase